jgi:RNA polymerase sigma-70 factor (sigma-E family)
VRDDPEYEAYVAARSRRLHHYAYLLTGDWAAAEDLVQTALVKAWFAWHRIDGNADPYVRRIIATTYTSWLRRRWSSEVRMADPPEVGTDHHADRHAERDALWRALRTLSRRQRAVLVLRYFEDLTQEETARTLGLSVGTVKSQTGRALAALRRSGLSDDGLTTDRLTTGPDRGRTDRVH